MKAIISPHKLMITLLTIVISLSTLSCKKDIIEDPDNPDNPNSRPELFTGTRTSFDSGSETEKITYENPFKELSLHNPSSLALVDALTASGKKSMTNTAEALPQSLYEVSADNLDLVRGAENNDITFLGIEWVGRINPNWHLFAGMDIQLITEEIEVTTSYDIQIDSIFFADTVPLLDTIPITDTIPIIDTIFNPYQNLGDTLFIGADTTLFHDTLWIQISYLFTDTLAILVDTAYIEVIQSFETLLLSTKTGNLYDVGEGIDYWEASYKMSDPYLYIEDEDCLYYLNRNWQISKLNLYDLSLVTHTLPYENKGPWTIVDGKIFFYSEGQFPEIFCYVPGQGLITKTNLGPNPKIGTIIFGELDNYIWVYGVQGNLQTPQGKYIGTEIFTMFTLSVRNDSMIFTPQKMNTEINIENVPAYFNESIGVYIGLKLWGPEGRWYFGGERTAWNFTEESAVFKIFSYLEINIGWGATTITNGRDLHVTLYNNTISKIDLSIPSVETFIEISELEIKDFRIGHKNNIFVSGMRFSDLNDVTIEYDGVTGEKLNVWVVENAPPESNITFLSPVY